jgi:hypothetical protein
MAAFTDHLWQSLLCLLVATVLVALLRNAGASVRLWILRITALKFLVPFALLQAVGGWIGFPVAHASEPAPASLVALIAELGPLLAPAQNQELSGTPAVAVTGLLSSISMGWLLWIARQLRVERRMSSRSSRGRSGSFAPR